MDLGSVHVKKKIILYIYLFTLSCAESLVLQRLFSSCGNPGLLSSCSPQTSHCSGFSCCRAWAIGDSGFSSCGSWALEHRLNSVACAIFPDQGLNPSLLALTGRFFITEPPGKPLFTFNTLPGIQYTLQPDNSSGATPWRNFPAQICHLWCHSHQFCSYLWEQLVSWPCISVSSLMFPYNVFVAGPLS